MSHGSVYTQSSQEDNGDHLLVAQMDNARVLSNILKTVQFKELVTCTVSSTGLKFTTEQAKCVQANAFIQSALFQYYNYTDNRQSVFRINVNALIDCLSIFGGGNNYELRTALKLYYDGYGTPLRLLLEENGVVTNCSIKTMESEEILDFDFISSNVCNKIIIKSECLKEAFAEMDTSSSVLEVLMSCDQPFFRLATYGDTGSTQFDCPKDSDMIEVFECNEVQCNKYSLVLLKPSTKALAQSSKVSIRVDKRGFLSLQYMIFTDDHNICFVEYLCVPEENNDITSSDQS